MNIVIQISDSCDPKSEFKNLVLPIFNSQALKMYRTVEKRESVDVLHEEHHLRTMSDLNLLSDTTKIKKFSIKHFNTLTRSTRAKIYISVAIILVTLFILIPVAVVIGKKNSQVLALGIVPSVDCPQFSLLGNAIITISGTIQIISGLIPISNSSHSAQSTIVTLQYFNSKILILSSNTQIRWITYNLVNVTLTGTPNACTLDIGNSVPVIQAGGIPRNPSSNQPTSKSIPQTIAIVYISPPLATNGLAFAQSMTNSAFGLNNNFENVNAMLIRFSGGLTSYDGLNNNPSPGVYNWTAPLKMYNSCDLNNLYNGALDYWGTQSQYFINYHKVIVVVNPFLHDCKFVTGSINGLLYANQDVFMNANGQLTIMNMLLQYLYIGNPGIVLCLNGFSNWSHCNPQEGVDVFDVMGIESIAPANLQVSSRIQLGWISPSNIMAIDTSQTSDVTLISADNYLPTDTIYIAYDFFTTFGSKRLKVNYTLELQSYSNAYGVLQCGIAVRVSSLTTLVKYFLTYLDYNQPTFNDIESGFFVTVHLIGLDCSYATITVQTIKASPLTLETIDSRPTIMLYLYYAQFPPPPTVDLYWVRDFYFGNNVTVSEENINAVYARLSNNYTQFTGLNAKDVDVYPHWIPLYNVPNDCTNACNIEDWRNTMIQIAGIDQTKYKHVIGNLVYNCGCDFGGVASIGGNFLFLNQIPVDQKNDAGLIGIAAHELGHNLKFYHAGGAYDYSTTDPSQRLEYEYGDFYDIMVININIICLLKGRDWSRELNFQVRHRVDSGWLTNDNIVQINNPGNYTITLNTSQTYLNNLTVSISKNQN